MTPRGSRPGAAARALPFARLLAPALLLLALAASCDKHHNVTAAAPPPSGPAPTPGPTPTPNADVCSGAAPYTLAGYHWATPAASFEYGSSLPSAWRASADAAAATWSAAGSSMRISHDPATGPADAVRDGKNVVCFGALPAGVLGTTYTWYNASTHVVAEADIKVTNALPMTVGGSPSSVDVQSVLTHEFGHFVGLDHVTDITQTMYPSIPNDSRIYRTLCDGDILGIRTIYP